MKPRMTEKQLLAKLRTDSKDEAAANGDAEPMSIEARCMHLEEENLRLKLLVADLTLRNEALKLVAWKKW